MPKDYVGKRNTRYGYNVYLRAVTAAEAGLTDSISGHILSDSTDPSQYGSVQFVCSCGFGLNGIRPKVDGTVPASTKRIWNNT